MSEIYLLVLSWLSPLLLDWAYRLERLDVASWIVDGAERAGSITLLVVSGIPFPVKKEKNQKTIVDIAPLPRWRESCSTFIIFPWEKEV